MLRFYLNQTLPELFMSAIAGILSDLINTLFGLYATIVLLRFIFQLVKADFYNPISQGIVRMTSPVLVPLRRVIPGLWGMDMAALLLALGINLIALALVMLVHGYNPLGDIAGILAVAFLRLLTSIMNIFSFSLLASIVLSWVAPMSSHPAAVLITQIAEPLMAPFRKIIPPMGGIDISPIFLFLVMGMVTKLVAAGAAAFGIMVQVVWLFVFI